MLYKTVEEEKEVRSFSNPTYKNFIGFVKRYIAPHTQSQFIEEPYYRQLWDETWVNRFTDAQISRGHSKSEVLVVWRAIYLGVIQPFNPHHFKAKGYKKKIKQILIVSSDQIVTDELVDRLRYYMSADDTLKQLLPSGGVERDLKDNTQKLGLRHGTTFYFRSIKMKRGLHPDVILLDDLTTELSTLTDNETWKLFTGAVLPMSLTHMALVTLDGTPIRSTDIMSKVRRIDTSTDEDTALVPEEAKSGWHHIHLPAYNRETSVLLSPQRFNMAELMKQKSMMGSAQFEAEYMLNPIDDSSSFIKGAWIDACRDRSLAFSAHRGSFSEVYLGWDFAFSDKITADRAVGVVVGKRDNKLYVLNIHVFRGLSGLEQLEKVKELHARYRFDTIGLEENSITAIQKEVKTMTMPDGSSIPIKLFRLTAHDDQNTSSASLKDVVNVGKQNFILRLARVFENQEIVLPDKNFYERSLIDELRKEATSWALEEGKLKEYGDHPDIPVALGYAIEASNLSTFAIYF